MNRRTFLGQALQHMAFGSLLMGGGPGGLLMSQAHAAATGRTLIVVFLRGGCDGLNMLVPYGESAYYTLRPTLGIAPPSANNPLSALDLDGFFGFHPSMAALHGLYQKGWVAALPAVHYPSATQSHFLGQDIIENATTLASPAGWLGRYLATLPSGAEKKALALTAGIPRSMSGSVPVSALADLRGLRLAATNGDEDLLTGLMASEYSRPPLVGHPYDARLRATGQQLLIDIAELQNVDALPTANGAAYPTTTFGRQMRQAAGLIKTRPGTELIALDLGGWDTHRDQGGAQSTGNQAKLLSQLSEATAALYTDLGSAASGVLLLAVTEFGRSADENSSGGTDHGKASSWLAVGPMVRGGMHSVNGWPGLAPTQLMHGRYLAQSTDYRDIYGEVLSRHLGVTSPSSLLEGYAPNTVGFL